MVEYISIREVADKWGITQRRVQELCKTGQIYGAAKFGRVWMIPEQAQKPMDGRKREAKQSEMDALSEDILPRPKNNPFLIHTDLYQTPGTADEVVKSLSHHPYAAGIMRAQFEYRRGNIELLYENVQGFLGVHDTFYSTLSAGILLSMCAVWKGDVDLWRKGRQHMYEAPCRDERVRHELEFWLAASASTVYDGSGFPEWFKLGVFEGLPADTYSSARVYYVKALWINAHRLATGQMEFADVEGMGLMRTLPYVIEPMISQARIERTLIPEIYLHLIAGSVYHNLGEDNKAIPHIDTAIRQCLPDRLYGILVEYRNNLDNLLDDRLKMADENALAEVRKMHKQMNSGWIKLHNLLLERSMSERLTIREREAAKLAAYGFSNAEIAKRMNLTLSGVKIHIQSAMTKCGALKRAELGLYV